MELIPAEEYEHLRHDADARLREGGKSDWPALAAALALEAEIWSEDVDFFGVGVPVWSTNNVQFVEVSS
jgi:predicted nucleic acid-binding protein